ncbi:MAG: transporter nucleotide binding/ATPase protein [Rhodospirillales bacterium]|nr:transporter nucleotide binding/ATPase protein [Rhodospirillales bacterium]
MTEVPTVLRRAAAVSGATNRGRPLISLAGVGKTYQNGTLALTDVNLSIGQGEFVSLLGPSGCGKSTLLRMIAGLGSTSEGSIDWPQSRYDAKGEPQRDLGFVFQEPTLMPWATVFENVYLPLKLTGVGKRAAVGRVTEVLAMVGLEKFAGSYPRELSGGMKMRASIARALVVKPQVLLMDEPFAALDEITRIRLNNDLLGLWQSQQWTVIFVTHSVYESVYLSNRIVVMSARPGRIVADLAIDAPYPRGEMFRTSSTYNEFCRTTSAELSRAMAGAEEEH